MPWDSGMGLLTTPLPPPCSVRKAKNSLCYWRHELFGELRPVTAASSSLPGEMGSEPPPPIKEVGQGLGNHLENLASVSLGLGDLETTRHPHLKNSKG